MQRQRRSSVLVGAAANALQEAREKAGPPPLRQGEPLYFTSSLPASHGRRVCGVLLPDRVVRVQSAPRHACVTEGAAVVAPPAAFSAFPAAADGIATLSSSPPLPLSIVAMDRVGDDDDQLSRLRRVVWTDNALSRRRFIEVVREDALRSETLERERRLRGAVVMMARKDVAHSFRVWFAFACAHATAERRLVACQRIQRCWRCFVGEMSNYLRFS